MNLMLQVASCEQALIKQIKNQLKTTRAKQCFFLKPTHWNLILTDISSTWLVIRECRVGFMQNECHATRTTSGRRWQSVKHSGFPNRKLQLKIKLHLTKTRE